MPVAFLICIFILEQALRVTTNHQNDQDRRAGVLRCQENVEKGKTRHKACEANDYSRPYIREQPMKNMAKIGVPPSKGEEKCGELAISR